jgi:hypothetical protein
MKRRGVSVCPREERDHEEAKEAEVSEFPTEA